MPARRSPRARARCCWCSTCGSTRTTSTSAIAVRISRITSSTSSPTTRRLPRNSDRTFAGRRGTHFRRATAPSDAYVVPAFATYIAKTPDSSPRRGRYRRGPLKPPLIASDNRQRHGLHRPPLLLNEGLSMLERMKIGTRLAVGFGLVSLVLAAVVVTGVTRLSALDDDIKTITRTNNVEIRHA